MRAYMAAYGCDRVNCLNEDEKYESIMDYEYSDW